MRAGLTLVCFAVKEEAAGFHSFAEKQPGVKVLLTGMGKRNAERVLQEAVERKKPDLVISAGFAGGLNPKLAAGTVVFSAEVLNELVRALEEAGAVPGRFHCSDRVATTAEEKRRLREATGADAIEMESEAICDVCRKQKIPSSIVRVILDSAQEDLPLDFNALMTRDYQMSYGKLVWALFKGPQNIPALIRLQNRSRSAAHRLAEVLQKMLAPD